MIELVQESYRESMNARGNYQKENQMAIDQLTEIIREMKEAELKSTKNSEIFKGN